MVLAEPDLHLSQGEGNLKKSFVTPIQISVDI